MEAAQGENMEQWVKNIITGVEIIFIILPTVVGAAIIWINKISPLPKASKERKELVGNVKNIVSEGFIAIMLIIAILNWPYIATTVVAVLLIRRTFLKVLDTA